MFHVDRKVHHVYNVGGRRSERKKWQYLFDRIGGFQSVVVFFVPMDCDNRTLVEDPNVVCYIIERVFLTARSLTYRYRIE